MSPYTRVRVDASGRKIPPLQKNMGFLCNKIADKASDNLRVWLATVNAFPEDEVKVQKIQNLILAACEDGLPWPEGRAEWFKRIPEWKADMIEMVNRTVPQYRGEFVSAARNQVTAQYNLVTLLPVVAGPRVLQLLLNGAFGFKDPAIRKGHFKHPAIAGLLVATVFKRGSGIGLQPDSFKPIPVPLLALTLSAIQCALTDLSKPATATDQSDPAKKSGFTHDIYKTVYANHMASLKEYNEDRLLRLCRELWEFCWKASGASLAAVTAAAATSYILSHDPESDEEEETLAALEFDWDED